MKADPKGSVDPKIQREAILNFQSYPCKLPSLPLGINDLGYQQKLLANPQNFSESTSCDVFQISADGWGGWKPLQSLSELRSSEVDYCSHTSQSLGD
jgi:hypothetical protein